MVTNVQDQIARRKVQAITPQSRVLGGRSVAERDPSEGQVTEETQEVETAARDGENREAIERNPATTNARS